MCPAEENANCGKLRPTSARRSSEKTDTRTSSFFKPLINFCGLRLFLRQAWGYRSDTVVVVCGILICSVRRKRA